VAPTEVTEGANRQGWRVVWVAFVVALFGWGVGFYGPAVYLAALHQTRGWSIATISSAITAHYLVSAALITALPGAYRRFGVGRVTSAGVLLAGAGALAWANAQQVWQLVSALILSGAGWSAMSGAALNAMVAPWFERDRPKAISTAFNGASVGGIVFVPLWTALIAGVGLSLAAFMVACATIAVVCPLVWHFLRREPGIAATTALTPSSRRSLLRQPGFVTISAAFALGLFAQIGLFAHLMARLEPDFGSGLAAAATSLVTLCAVAGRTLLGWFVGDRDRRVVAAANLLMQAAGSLLLAFGQGMAALAAGCVLFGLGVGNLVSLPPLIAQSEFRPADVGTVVALVTAINQAVFALGPAVFGGLRDFTGNYVVAFLMATAAQLVAAAVIAYGRRYS
jgi:predicted MFS family arabinose efflux permease